MSQPENIIDKRMANARFPAAQAGMLVGILGGLGLNMLKNIMGGLWVGGNAWLTNDAVIFQANAMNKMVHRNSQSLEKVFPLSEIAAIEDRFGLFTSIIDIKTADETFSIRCYDAKGFSAAIRKAAGQT